MAERLIARRCEQASRKVALVQHQALDKRLAVEPEAAVPGIDRAQPEIALDAIHHLAVPLEKPSLEVVKPRRIRMPRDDAVELNSPAAGHARPPARDLAVEHRDHLRLAGGVELDIESTRTEGGREAEALDVTSRQRLQPHRLPDSGRGRVEDAFRVGRPVLLA